MHLTLSNRPQALVTQSTECTAGDLRKHHSWGRPVSTYITRMGGTWDDGGMVGGGGLGVGNGGGIRGLILEWW
jgi:hypothetical protein